MTVVSFEKQTVTVESDPVARVPVLSHLLSDGTGGRYCTSSTPSSPRKVTRRKRCAKSEYVEAGVARTF